MVGVSEKKGRRRNRKVRFETDEVLTTVSEDERVEEIDNLIEDEIQAVMKANIQEIGIVTSINEEEEEDDDSQLQVGEDVIKDDEKGIKTDQQKTSADKNTVHYSDSGPSSSSLTRRKPVQHRLLNEYFKAVEDGKIDEVKPLLKKMMVKNNFDEVDMNDRKGRTALLKACQNNDIEMVTLLLKMKPKSPDVNKEDIDKMRPLMWAVENGSKEMAKKILTSKNCEVNFLDKKRGFTPLYRSIIKNKAGLCRVLIHAGADVNLRQLGVIDPLAETPLIKAIQRNNWKICDMLLNSLCKKNARTSAGCTALHYAIAYRRYEIVELLLQNRVDMYQPSVHGVTPMSLAIEQHLPLMVKTMLRYGYDSSKRSPLDELPLEQSIILHSEQCAMTLVLWGCDITRPHPPSYFQMAVDEGLIYLAQLLMSLKPTFLNEKWVIRKSTPLALYQQPAFCESLFTSSSQSLSLLKLCRAKLLLYLGRKAPEKIRQLGLPEKLADYVSFDEYFPEGFYSPKTLDFNDCPFDCPAFCGRRNCPKLDFYRSPDEYEIT